MKIRKIVLFTAILFLLGFVTAFINKSSIITTSKNVNVEHVKASNIDSLVSISYQAHMSSIGWMDYVSDGVWAGYTNSSSSRSNRLEAVRFKLTNNSNISGGIRYRVHVSTGYWPNNAYTNPNSNNQYGGWTGYTDGKSSLVDWITPGDRYDGISGSVGISKHMEAIQLELTGDLRNYCYLDYNVHTYYTYFATYGVDASAVLNKNIGITDKYELLTKLPGWDIDSYGDDVADTNWAGTYRCTLPITGFNAMIYMRNIELTIDPNGGKYADTTDKTSSTIEVSSVNDIETPTREGYTFTGWDIEHTPVQTMAIESNNYQPAETDIEGNLDTANNTYTAGNMDVLLTANWRANPTSVVVKYVDERTGKEIIKSETISGYVGDDYTTTRKDIEGYNFSRVDGLENGTMGANPITITYYYKADSFEITTEVKTHKETNGNGEEIDVKGGYISGEGQTPYETVYYKENSQKDIIITPDENYQVKEVLVNNIPIKFMANESGIVTLDKFIGVTEDKHITVEFDRIPTTVIVHHYIVNTTNKVPLADGGVAQDETIRGKVGDNYNTKQVENLAKNYELADIPKNASGTMTKDTIVVTYYYKLKDPVIQTADITKESSLEKITDVEQVVDYTINYKVSVDTYIGNAIVTIVDELPYEIDEGKSDLAGGTYSSADKTITWTEKISNIDTFANGTREISITKKIKLVYKDIDVTKSNIENKIIGKIDLETPNKEETVEDVKEIPTQYLVDIKVQKIWNDYDNTYQKRPSQIYIVLKDGENEVGREIFDNTKLEHTFENLPKYDNLGNEIKYTVTEEEKNKGDLEFYEGQITGSIDTGYTITNTMTKIPGTVVIKYVDKNTGKEISPQIVREGIVGETFDVTGDRKNITGYTLVEEPSEKVGIYTIEEQEKIYYYAKNTQVIVRYLEEDDTPEDNTDNKVLEKDVLIDGYEGKSYDTEQKEIENYTFVKATDNKKGIMTEEPIEVIYYYAQNTKATVQHIDRETGEILKEETQNGKVGDLFETKAEDFEGYVLVESPEEANIVMDKTGEQVVKYYYAHVSAGLIEKHIDEASGELIYSEKHDGNEGDYYNIPSRTFEGYDLVTEDSEGNSKLPTNAEGEMLRDEVIEVKYYYIKKAKVVVKYLEYDNTPEDNTDNLILAEEVIDGHENDEYSTEIKEIDGYNLVEIPQNSKGTMIITENPDGTYDAEIEVVYYYKKIAGGVIENHIDITTDEKLATEKHEGNVGDEYDIQPRDFENYDLVTTDKEGNNKLPENAKGAMTEEELEVNYYYIKQAKVIVEYIDKLTGEKIDEEEINIHIGDEYSTEEKEFDGYDIVERPSNGMGEITEEEIVVQYYYRKKAEVEVKYLEKETENEVAESDIIEGYVADSYETAEKIIPYYNFVEKTDNYKGEMEEEKITVIYYYEKQVFNLGIDKWISNVDINGTSQGIRSIDDKDKIYKIDIHRNKVETTDVKVTYKIRVTNKGEIEGTVGEILEIIPTGYSYHDEDNSIRWIDRNGILVTDYLKDDVISAGEYKELEIVLRWNAGEENFGQKDNKVILSELDNPAGYEDTNETDNNSTASMIMAVATGLGRNYIIIIGIVQIVIIGSIGLLLKYKKKGK